jgi:hypothetical protein
MAFWKELIDYFFLAALGRGLSSQTRPTFLRKNAFPI